jgi:hypothetical protein
LLNAILVASAVPVTLSCQLNRSELRSMAECLPRAWVVKLLNSNPALNLTVEGHTDPFYPQVNHLLC